VSGWSTALVDPVADPRWGPLVARAPDAVVFHHPAWLALLTRRYRYAVHAVGVVRAGELVAGLPFARVESRLTGRRLVALPFSDACPPLLADPAARGPLLDAVAAARPDDLRLEVRADVADLAGGEVAVRHVEHVLALDRAPERIEREVVRPALRRGAAKARRSGVVVQRCTDAAALETFYVLHRRTRRRQGVPTQPRRAITELHGVLAACGGFVLVARRGDVPLAAAVFLAQGRTLTYKYGASDERHLAVRPNNLLFLEAIRHGWEAGLERLDLGRTDLGNAGLRAFKASLGAQERPLPYTYVGGVPAERAGGPAGRVLSAAIRQAPPVVGGLVGAALYRHAG